ncbi:ABC transporter ATP-binding protein [Microvirga sp. M2]|uniref:ABC transporter ATP-binding protein n=1 Tax=Microvirga sp. M2 TaxID=3073270 RepID=UPI0039C19248
MTALLQAKDLVRVYETRPGLWTKPTRVRAVDRVSLTVSAGETLGIVGESGSGKSTLGRMLLGIDPASEGQVLFDGKPMPEPGTPAWRKLRAQMQLVFQDPLAALDRRLPVAEQIGEPLAIHGLVPPADVKDRVFELMAAVGLRRDQGGRYPHELSGGQRQRVVIARALAAEPRLLVCDEPVSALDVSIQAQVVNLLRELQERHGIAMVFISHDLKVVRNIADRVAVMYLGRIVEMEASSDEIFAKPLHPYTRALVSSVPIPGRKLESRIILQGEPPNPPGGPQDAHSIRAVPWLKHSARAPIPHSRRSKGGRVTACHFPILRKFPLWRKPA